MQPLSLKPASNRNLVCDLCLLQWLWREIGCATSVSKIGFKENRCASCVFHLFGKEMGCVTSVSKTGFKEKSGVRRMSRLLALERNMLCKLCL